MWYTLSGRYGDLDWEMLIDMKGKKFSHKKANKHLAYIMNNWPAEEVVRTVRTWLMKSTIDINKLDETLSLKFRDKYGVFVVKNSPFEMWPKPSKI